MQAIKEIEFQYVTNQAWEKTAVLLPIAEFEEILEDFSDLALIAERRDEKTVTQEELTKQLCTGSAEVLRIERKWNLLDCFFLY